MTSTANIGDGWKLGGTRLVNRIGLGAMQLPKWPGGPPADRDTAIEVLRTAVELGVNHVDTASFYVQDGVSANDLLTWLTDLCVAGL